MRACIHGCVGFVNTHPDTHRTDHRIHKPHITNKYTDLVDLKVLPADTDRGKVLPVMERVIGPYVFQGTVDLIGWVCLCVGWWIDLYSLSDDTSTTTHIHNHPSN